MAPTEDCEEELACKWSAYKDTINIVWGDAGLHQLKASSMKAAKGTMLTGKRVSDNDPCTASFVKQSYVPTADDIERDL